MTKRSRPRVLSIGVISEGTLRPNDLVDALINTLRPLRLSRVDRATLRAAEKALRAYDEATGDDDRDADPPQTRNSPMRDAIAVVVAFAAGLVTLAVAWVAIIALLFVL